MLDDLWSYLTTAPSVDLDPTRAAALDALQTLIGTRLYPDVLKERADLPAATYQLIDAGQDYLLDATPIDIVFERIQFDVYSKTHADRELIGGYLKTALGGYTGVMVGTDTAILMFDNELNGYDPDSLQYRKTLDFKVVHYT